MAVRIHQLLAIIGGLNTETDASLAKILHVASKPDLFTGKREVSTLVDTPSDPGARPRLKTPDQAARVRVTAASLLEDTQKLLTAKWDTALTLDTAQADAEADVVIGDVTVLRSIPVRHLVYLEGELTRLAGVVAALPELDGVRDWTTENAEPGQYRSAHPVAGTRSAKVMFNWGKGNGTANFKEDVEIMTRDEVVETTSTVNFSGALPAERKALLLERLFTLKTAVRMSREEANSAQVDQMHEGSALFGYLFAP
jgi:hypothetical protein